MFFFCVVWLTQRYVLVSLTSGPWLINDSFLVYNEHTGGHIWAPVFASVNDYKQNRLKVNVWKPGARNIRKLKDDWNNNLNIQLQRKLN